MLGIIAFAITIPITIYEFKTLLNINRFIKDQENEELRQKMYEKAKHELEEENNV